MAVAAAPGKKRCESRLCRRLHGVHFHREELRVLIPAAETGERRRVRELVMVERIANRCPSCGHDSLFVANGGWLTCSWLPCLNPGLDGALQQARLDIIRTSQLEHELEEARREAAAMRDERDREIGARKAIERGSSVDLAHLLMGIRGSRSPDA